VNCFGFATASADCNGASILIGLRPTYDQVLDIQRENETSQLAQIREISVKVFLLVLDGIMPSLPKKICVICVIRG
jgi:hypothetical protein